MYVHACTLTCTLVSCSSELFDGTTAVPSLFAVDFKDVPDLWGDVSRSRVCKTVRCVQLMQINALINAVLTVFLS